MKRPLLLVLAFTMLATARMPAQAPAHAPPAGQELEALTSEVAAQLRCPVCRQLSVQDSEAELSREMKAVIRDRLAAGDTPEEVKAYFVRKYGQWILLAPPKRGFTLLVWVLPLAALLGGGVLLALFFRRWLGGAA